MKRKTLIPVTLALLLAMSLSGCDIPIRGGGSVTPPVSSDVVNSEEGSEAGSSEGETSQEQTSEALQLRSN